MTAGVVDPGLLRRVRARLAAEPQALDAIVMAAAVRAEADGLIGDTDMVVILRELETELTGTGVLAPLLTDPAVTDVLVNAPDQVWTDGVHGLRRSSIEFADEAAVRRLAQRLAVAAGRRLDDAQPWVDGRLDGGEGTDAAVRLHAVLAPIAVGGTTLSLRVLRPVAHTLDALVAAGSIGPELLPWIRALVAARLSFLVAGGTGSGKTTLLAALLGAVTAEQRIITVEDAPELAPQHPHVVRLVARAANVEGRGAVSLRDLVRQALRMRPDRLVVGEVRGAEVVDMLGALNTGHDGGAGTVHANSADEVPARMEALGAVGGWDAGAVHSQLAAAVQAVLFVRRRADGDRVLDQLGVLDAVDGRTRVIPVWSHGIGWGPGSERLAHLLAARGHAVPR